MCLYEYICLRILCTHEGREEFTILSSTRSQLIHADKSLSANYMTTTKCLNTYTCIREESCSTSR